MLSGAPVFVNFLTNSQEVRSTLRPIDVLVYGWVGDKYAFFELDCSFFTCGIRE
jgi:hypothetical protein